MYSITITINIMIQKEESTCNTCDSSMCEICSEKHNNKSYQLNLEGSSAYYYENKTPKITGKIKPKLDLKIGDIIEYNYGSNSSYTSEAEVIDVIDREKRIIEVYYYNRALGYKEKRVINW